MLKLLYFPTSQGWKTFCSIADYYLWLKNQGLKHDNIQGKYLSNEVNAYWANHRCLHEMLEVLRDFYQKNLYPKVKDTGITPEQFQELYADFYYPWKFEEFFTDPFSYVEETAKLIRDDFNRRKAENG